MNAKLVSLMASIISRKADMSGLRLEPIHSMDDRGTLQGVLVYSNHTMKIEAGWGSCGAVWELISCDCGFSSKFFSGGGCWQHDHNGPAVEHSLDLLHAALYEAAKEWERNRK